MKCKWATSTVTGWVEGEESRRRKKSCGGVGEGEEGDGRKERKAAESEAENREAACVLSQ